MYDDAEWAKFGIDPQQRAAFEKFAAEYSRKTMHRHDLSEEERQDCEMDMYVGLFFSCLDEPDRSDAYRIGVMRNKARMFVRRKHTHDEIFVGHPIHP